MVIAWDEQAAAHMWKRHKISTDEANEAIGDVAALALSPDPASKSGLTDRIIGYSNTLGVVLAVIVHHEGQTLHGVNGWKANARDQRDYWKAKSND